jgi:uncharacterized membrane protein (Fun14 family)
MASVAAYVLQIRNPACLTALLIDPNLSSVRDRLLFGAVVGYAIKKLMKIAAVVVGLFVVGRPMTR